MAEGPERHPHLRLPRSGPVNPKRTRPGPIRKPPADPRAHGARLTEQLDDASATHVFEAGFDPRRLLKLVVDGLDPSELDSIPGLELVSQEDRTIIVLFATEQGRAEFRSRLQLLARGGTPTRKEILWAVQAIEELGPKDRMAPALKREGTPNTERFVLDVELWPLERGPERTLMTEAFVAWCESADVRVYDQVNQPAIVLFRVQATLVAYHRLLQHRDVRLVDLPPRHQLLEAHLRMDIASLQELASPSPNAPLIAVLDSGVASNHPVLESAIGDSQSYLRGLPAQDSHGHGTAVAGLALYGDVHACIQAGKFVPRLWIVSGRVLDDQAQTDWAFLENRIAEAVEYFTRKYGCRIFNLSLGDERKPYTNGHVRGLAVTLDTLSRQYGVLFVVSAGNYFGDDDGAPNWRADYPGYLLERETARIVDPAPALNVLTVGALARFEQSRQAQRHAKDPGYQPVARADEPSPFSRTGPGPGGAIKPELVAYGGNVGVDLRTGASLINGSLLGEPAPNLGFADGALFRDRVGTSFAAPQVAHLAGRLLETYPEASANLLRALIVAHASTPGPSKDLPIDEASRRRLLGYGKPSLERCLYSTQSCVSLRSEDEIGVDETHFYEVPLPPDFLSVSRRERVITVALAHTPIVRTTRADYRASKMSFRLVAEDSLDAVTRIYRKTAKQDREEALKEFRDPSVGPNARDKGTVQAASYEVKTLSGQARGRMLFVVVTRSVPRWAKSVAASEPYALVAVLEDRSQHQVRYYQQIVEIQQRVRGRARV